MPYSTHQAAWRGYCKRPLTLINTFLLHALVRLFAWLPVWAANHFHRPALLPYALALTFLLYVLIVFPLRFATALYLTRLTRQGNNRRLRLSAYKSLVGAGLMRLLLGGLWCLPAAGMLYRTYQYIFVLDGTRWGKDFAKFGQLLFPALNESAQRLAGTSAFFVVLILCLLLCLYGWWRGTAFDFQMVGAVSPFEAYRTFRRVRKKCRWALVGNMLLHILLCLPALILPLLPLYVKLRPMLSGNAMEGLQLLYIYLSAGVISDGTLYLCAALFLLLYLPFLPYRKLRNAAAVVNCYAPKR